MHAQQQGLSNEGKVVHTRISSYGLWVDNKHQSCIWSPSDALHCYNFWIFSTSATTVEGNRNRGPLPASYPVWVARSSMFRRSGNDWRQSFIYCLSLFRVPTQWQFWHPRNDRRQSFYTSLILRWVRRRLQYGHPGNDQHPSLKYSLVPHQAGRRQKSRVTGNDRQQSFNHYLIFHWV